MINDFLKVGHKSDEKLTSQSFQELITNNFKHNNSIPILKSKSYESDLISGITVNVNFNMYSYFEVLF